MREAIQQFTLDKQAAPQSLNDLVSAGYLRDVPTDPMTHSENWNVTFDNGGVIDVHSGSNAVSPFENTPYNIW